MKVSQTPEKDLLDNVVWLLHNPLRRVVAALQFVEFLGCSRVISRTLATHRQTQGVSSTREASNGSLERNVGPHLVTSLVLNHVPGQLFRYGQNLLFCELVHPLLGIEPKLGADLF